MNVPSIAATLVLAALSTVSLPAAVQDAAGAWTLTFRTRDGHTLTSTLTLKLDGNKLSGTLSSPRGTVPVDEGTVDGDRISFAIIRVGFGDKIRVDYTGTISGDTMRLKMKNGAREPVDVTAKRAAQ